jgi:hypothetical protein
MSLEFEKIVPQVAQMGRSLATRTVTVASQTRDAGERLMQFNDLDAIWEKIMVARDHDAGFRGAAPYMEPVNQAIACPDCPSSALLLASDGSQIYPDAHGAALYWLTNIGVFVYPMGGTGLPEAITEPRLFFDDKYVRDSEGRIIANAAINAWRSTFEMQMLARESRHRRDRTKLMLALYDGPLLSLPKGKEVPNANQLEDDYHEALGIMFDLRAGLAGYVDRPKSTFVVNMIYLMTLEDDQIVRSRLQTAGPFEGLSDRDLYQWILGPGDRSGVMIQQSPQNKQYALRDPNNEIAFFYLNVAGPTQEAYLARVEVPLWIARDTVLVGAIHALIYDQCRLTDRFPYALTRADEIAVVQSFEKQTLDEMIAIELLQHNQQLEISKKLDTKGMARSFHQQHKHL